MTAVVSLNSNVHKRIKRRRITPESDDVDNNLAGEVTREVSSDQEDAGSLFESLSPLLTCMRLFGMYFKWPFGEPPYHRRKTERQRGGSSHDSAQSHRSTKEVISAIYSIIVTALLWFNAIRMITVFTPYDTSLYEIVTRVIIFIWTAMCAVQQTAFFVASRSGKLDQVLAGLRFKSHENNSYIHRYAVIFTAAQLAMLILNTTFYCLNLTVSMNRLTSFLLAPIGTYITVSDMTVFQVFGIVFSAHLSIACTLPSLTSAMLCAIFCIQFRLVDKQLREAIKKPAGISDDDLEDIREQHQKLCRLVERADCFLRIHNCSGIIGNIVCFIALLYTIIKYANQAFSSPVSMFIFVFYIILNSVGLLVTAIGGTLVNHYAHKTRDHIHNIKLSLLSSKTIGKVNVFLNRTSGEPIGFTVMGIIVIDKSALTGVMSQLVTYFLLLIQFPVSNDSSTCSSTSDQDITNVTHSK